MEDKKIIVKSSYLHGVDMSIADLVRVSAIPVSITYTTSEMYKKGSQAFVVLKDKLMPGEVIQVGDYSIKYKIVSLVSPHESGGWVHRVKRVDGYNITQLDIDGIHPKQKTLIVSRKSYNQIWDEATFYENTKYVNDSDNCENCS